MSKREAAIEKEVIDINAVEVTPEDTRGKRLNLLWFLMYIVCIISICIVIITFCFQRSVVDGNSMEPTLVNGESLLVGKLSYKIGKVKRYDVVVFNYDNTKGIKYVKRVIGLPGETVQIIDGKVMVNGVALADDTYSRELMTDPGIAANPVVLGDNEYFVLGDNRNASADSRMVDVGKVNKNQIVGKVLCRIWPLDKFGGI